jgi:hypothetical protein
MENFEKQIGNAIANAGNSSVKKLGLRFDRVVVRLLGDIRQSIEQHVPKNLIFIMTITAPIKHPAKTAEDVTKKIKDSLKSGIQKQDSILTVFENKVQFRIAQSSPKQTEKFIGLVHNPEIDATMLLDLAAQWLLK